MTHRADAPPSDARIELSSGLTVRTLEGADELTQACRLYRTVFGYTGEDESLNPRLLSSLLNHSGSVVGAVDSTGAVLAFAYGWTASDTDPDDPHMYHFSQAAVVSSVLQGQGVGRSLKRVQAAVATHNGAHRMRWTYDPLLARNAHFNLDVLGARGRWYTPDAQGAPGTDRITVDWHFTIPVEEPTEPLPQVRVGDIQDDGAARLLGLPSAKPASTDLAERLTARIRDLFARGYEATSCRRISHDTAVYRFERP